MCTAPFSDKMFIIFDFAITAFPFTFAGWCWWWAGWSYRKRFLRTAGLCMRLIRYTVRAQLSCTRCRRNLWVRWASSTFNNEKWLRRYRTTVSTMHLDVSCQTGSKETSINKHERTTASMNANSGAEIRACSRVYAFFFY